MAGSASPVVRGWEITGAGVDDPVALSALRDEIIPRIQAVPGYLGGYMLVDHERSALLVFGFWADAAAFDASVPISESMAAAVLTLTSAEVTRRWRCDPVVMDTPVLVGTSGGSDD